MIRRFAMRYACILVMIFVATVGVADEHSDFFEAKVRPLLMDRCLNCHDGSEKAKSELAITSHESLVAGGEYGPALLPGRPGESLLIQAIRGTHKELHMPPKDADKLSEEDIEILARWVSEGAVWPGGAAVAQHRAQDEGPTVPFDPERDWALLPRKAIEPPVVKDERWSSNEIDRFVQRQRIEQGITPVDRADRRTLIRRATFDLTGLPPEPEDVAQFLEDPSDDRTAFAKVVDRLLDSPRYGERQGRLWLDVARYADTQGDVGDYPIHTAYLYRNWVINALNRDMPFNEFVRAQLAGDILAADAENEALARELTMATGFISLSRRFGNSKKDSMHLTIEDTIDTVGRGLMGLTLRCARCHDHKFDPVSDEDYYALYGIFESTIYPWMGMSIEKSPTDLSPAIPSKEERKKADDYWNLIAHYEYQINNHFRPWLKPTLDEYKDVCGRMDRLEKDEVDTEGQMTKLEERKDKLLDFRGGKFRELMEHGLSWVKEEKKRIAKKPGVELVFAVGEGTPGDANMQMRGNPKTPGEKIPRGFPKEVKGPERPAIGNGSGRLELANWISDPAHPLTARVMVNRLWQQQFGRGLVGTPDNFGRQGEKPTHPELLDWLAERFVQEGWSIKEMHRLLLNTETYQLASAGGTAERESVDPENRTLWKYSRRRLDSEEIRDGMLAVSGTLDLAQPGGHDILPWYEKRYGLNGPFHEEIETNRRSVYLLTQRIYRHSQLGLFDAPDRNSSTSSRSSSHVPAQALFLMNSELVKDRATHLADRVIREAKPSDRIDWLFRHLYAREPEEGEKEQLSGFLKAYRESAAEEDREMVALCRVLLTSNEFFFID